MTADTFDLITRYYAAFNAGDMDTFLSLLTDDVVHDVNQGAREIGKVAFASFMERMNRHYREELVGITIMTAPDGARAAAEFTVLGEYLATDEGAAAGQRTKLPPECLRVFCRSRWQGGSRHQLLQSAGLDQTGGRLKAARSRA